MGRSLSFCESCFEMGNPYSQNFRNTVTQLCTHGLMSIFIHGVGVLTLGLSLLLAKRYFTERVLRAMVSASVFLMGNVAEFSPPMHHLP
jgi:hypothetical protein